MKAEPIVIPFLQQYLSYVGETEAPMFYHRWSALSAVGAYLERQYSFSHGHFKLHPNLYVMLIGDPGTRKSTAIKLAKSLLEKSGYDKFSSDKTTKEKFLMDLAGIGDDEDGQRGGSGHYQSKDKHQDINQLLDSNLWGEDSASSENLIHAQYIACDEFNDFIGTGNTEFISILGNLWDKSGTFKHRVKNGKSVSISNPTVSILGGNTSTSFANAFPADTLGQGFFSRLLLIHGESTGKLITFPELPPVEHTIAITSALQRIKLTVTGEATLGPGSMELLDKIYKTYKGISDTRFNFYASRRFTHLLKLCLVISATHYSTEITTAHVVEANTILTHTEHLMPKALGEFGKAKNSDVTHKIMGVLNKTEFPMKLIDVWHHVSSDLDKMSDLGEMLRKLQAADKIFVLEGGGYLSKIKVIEEVNNDMLDYSYLTDEERGMTK